jgi:hypothetical protein
VGCAGVFNGTNLEHYLIKNWEIIADVFPPGTWDTREGRRMKRAAANPQPTERDGVIAATSIRKFVSHAKPLAVGVRLPRVRAYPFKPQHFSLWTWRN